MLLPLPMHVVTRNITYRGSAHALRNRCQLCPTAKKNIVTPNWTHRIPSQNSPQCVLDSASDALNYS